MNKLIKLAERLKTEPDDRAKVVEFLEKHLEKAREGFSAGVVVITKARDGAWLFDQGGDMSVTELLGRLEIIKHEIAANFVADMNREG